MPVVAKQRPTGPAKQVVPVAGSLLSRAKPIKQEVLEYIHLLLWGKNRCGKTVLSCQFEKPLLLISVEEEERGGSKSVSHIEGVTRLQWGVDFHTVEDVRSIGVELSQGNHPYKSVVIDSGTALDERMLAKVCGWKNTIEMNRFGKVSQDRYTERSEQMRICMRPFLELPINVIITANEKDHNPREGAKRNAMVRDVHTESVFGAAMGGATALWVQNACDIAQLYIDREYRTEEREITRPAKAGKQPTKEIVTEEVETGKFIRRLRVGHHPNFITGLRSATFDYENVQDHVDGKTPQEMHDNLIKLLKGE